MKKIISTLMLLCVLVLQAQETQNESSVKQNNIKIKLKEKVSPNIYVNGKKFDFSLDLIDQSKIATINVIKDKATLSKYNSPNGLILITTKSISEIKEVTSTDLSNSDPIMIIDGKISSKSEVEKLDPNNIKNVNVIKGDEAIKKYKSPNGVVIIKTKKK